MTIARADGSYFNFWWLKHLKKPPRKRPLFLLKRVSDYLVEHPPARPLRSPVPFIQVEGAGFCYLVASGAGLEVICYDHQGQLTEKATIEEFFERYSTPSGKAYASRRALENFHELLARYVFPPE